MKDDYLVKPLNVPTTDIPKLRKNPLRVFDYAKSQKTGVYVFNRDKPSGIVLSVNVYEEMVRRLNKLEDELLDFQTTQKVEERIKNDNGKRYTDEEVRGSEFAHKLPVIDENDGWE